MYHKNGWVQQFHLGELRNTNVGKLKKFGADTGFDSIGDFPQASSMATFFDKLDRTEQLARTILYNLNPADNESFATMAGNCSEGPVKGKMQFGAAWWFLDQLEGMEKQINALSNMSILSSFVGMLTDSRCFLSYSRHEYFRRLLCNIFGKDMEAGLIPRDEKWIGKIIQDICYNNAKEYFRFDK
jgi:glucuronate isomerase